jgi:hypothetical protein
MLLLGFTAFWNGIYLCGEVKILLWTKGVVDFQTQSTHIMRCTWSFERRTLGLTVYTVVVTTHNTTLFSFLISNGKNQVSVELGYIGNICPNRCFNTDRKHVTADASDSASAASYL